MAEEKKYCYQYPHAALTVDCVIFGFDGEALKVLLVERGLPPYLGMWALPGGFMRMDETVEQAAARELREETNLSNVYLEQFRVFSDVGRDPRERVVTVAFMALVRPAECRLIAGDDAANALWFDECRLPPMAFDHEEIIKAAREYLAEKLKVRPVAFQLLNKVFSLGELQKVYEAINRTTYDRRNFQRKALQSGMLEETDGAEPMCECGMPSPMAERMDKSSGAFDRPVSAGRPAKKLFSFRNLFKNKKEYGSDESSTKDLFDF
ncbi:MAG: NUDIX hydrolase [Firmicutes bacterium]|nr:NUDIX hydrolase [Bacillota bacterium]MCM1401287.1 NUDIX hydrolase [Bacteroides sp.]MCM1476758.1 NUDIX hydrolase [Bacteroides sp.]